MVANVASQGDYEALTKVLDLLSQLAAPDGAMRYVAQLIKAKDELSVLTVAQAAKDTELQLKESELEAREAAVWVREKASAVVAADLQAVKERIAKATAALVV